MADDIIEYEFDELREGTPVGVSTKDGDNSTFFAGERQVDRGGPHRKRLTDDFDGIEVAISEDEGGYGFDGTRYFVGTEGDFTKILNEDREDITPWGKYTSISVQNKDPRTFGGSSQHILMNEALDGDFEALYLADGSVGGSEGPYVLADDGDQVHNAMDLGLLEMSGTELAELTYNE